MRIRAGHFFARNKLLLFNNVPVITLISRSSLAGMLH
jgi:hypothetical protein